MTQYAVTMWLAFGDAGVNRREAAVPGCRNDAVAVASAASTARTKVGSFRRTRRAFYERVRAHACRTAGPHPSGLRGLRERRPPGARPRLRSWRAGRSSFPRPLEEEGKLGFWRWASMWLGIAGTYRKHETVDVVYESGGRRRSRPASSSSRTRPLRVRGGAVRPHRAPLRSRRRTRRSPMRTAVGNRRRRSPRG